MIRTILRLLFFCLLITAGRAFSQDQLGRATGESIACPLHSPGADCYAVRISCPDLEDDTVYLKLMAPLRPSAVAVLETGGLGNGLYEFGTYGRTTVSTLAQANFTVVEESYGSPFITDSEPQGWQINTNGAGVRKAACRDATLLSWIKTNFAREIPMCVTGNSAGAARIGYGLAHYNLDSIISFALLSSGPPFSRLDWACNDRQPAQPTYCSGKDLGMGVLLPNAEEFIDPAYEPAYTNACSNEYEHESTSLNPMFLRDSIINPDGNFSYRHRIEFVYGGQDPSPAPNQGEEYRLQITSPTIRKCVADAPHTITDALDGALLIADELIANCR